MLRAICSDNVDLPMPGSPPIRVTEPGTMPPPRTRLNSLLLVSMRVASVVAISDIGNGLAMAARPDALTPPPKTESISSFKDLNVHSIIIY